MSDTENPSDNYSLRTLNIPHRMWSHVIVFAELSDEFVEYPIDGFKNCPRIEDQLKTEDLDFSAVSWPLALRGKIVKLVFGLGLSMVNCRIFARVEHGNSSVSIHAKFCLSFLYKVFVVISGVEPEFRKYVVKYLNNWIGEGSIENKIRRYNQLLPLHSDVVLADYLYMKKKLPTQHFSIQHRTKRGGDIKFEQVFQP